MFLCDSFHVGPALKFLSYENNFLSSGLAERFGPSEKRRFLCGYCAVRAQHQTAYSSTLLCMVAASWPPPGFVWLTLDVTSLIWGSREHLEERVLLRTSMPRRATQGEIWFFKKYSSGSLMPTEKRHWPWDSRRFSVPLLSSPPQFGVSCDELALWIVSLSAQYS